MDLVRRVLHSEWVPLIPIHTPKGKILNLSYLMVLTLGDNVNLGKFENSNFYNEPNKVIYEKCFTRYVLSPNALRGKLFC